MALPKNITNKKYGRLIAIKFAEKVGTNHKWLFKCDCGNEIVAYKNAVIFGNTSSCGCLLREITSKIFTTHGMAGTRFYSIWRHMNDRCYNKNYIETKYYSEKGIKVEWKFFSDFKKGMYASYQDHCLKFGEKNTSIDRIDSDRNYCKENCRWATPKEQANNRKYYISNMPSKMAELK